MINPDDKDKKEVQRQEPIVKKSLDSLGRKSPKSMSKSSSPLRNQTNITSSPSHPLLAKAPKIK